MDGLRKVPDNVPKFDMVERHLGKPLTAVPDPFGTHESFGAHNNAKLCSFLDEFGFDYEFKSATECYGEGLFDEVLNKVIFLNNLCVESLVVFGIKSLEKQ